MSYGTGTTHYNLPITVGSDKRDWGDTNQAFQDIDAAIFQASEDATSAGSGVTALDTQINGVGGIDARLTQSEQDIDNVEGDVSTLQGTVSGHTTQIADVRQDAEDMIVAVEITAAQMEDAPVALTAGKYFRYNDVLYRVTVDIAVHDVIVPNTNCVATNVATELETLNAGSGQVVTASDVTYDNTLSGLTADDVQEAIDEVTSALTNINTRVDVNTSGTSVTLNSYTSDKYTFPSDGYLQARAASGNYITAFVYDANDTQMFVEGQSTAGDSFYSTVFVRKGMKTKIDDISGGTLLFIPLS